MEGAISYCPEAGFAWCAVLLYPAVAKGVGTRAEATDAMDGDGGTEISYIHAEGYPAAEMKHGPIALVDQDMPIVFLATHHQLYEKIISNMQEVKSRNGRILAVVTEGDQQVKKIADNVLEIPRTLNALVPLLSVVPLQLLAYYVAVDKGLDVDMPRNLAKSVTVE